MNQEESFKNMRSRLTLNINKNTIEKARRHSKINNISLSEIVKIT